MDDVTDCTLGKFADDRKLGGVSDTWDGSPAAIQRYHDRLEKSIDRNLLMFSKGKHLVLHLAKVNLVQAGVGLAGK